MQGKLQGSNESSERFDQELHHRICTIDNCTTTYAVFNIVDQRPPNQPHSRPSSGGGNQSHQLRKELAFPDGTQIGAAPCTCWATLISGLARSSRTVVRGQGPLTIQAQVFQVLHLGGFVFLLGITHRMTFSFQ
jgi:hypothetical protein